MVRLKQSGRYQGAQGRTIEAYDKFSHTFLPFTTFETGRYSFHSVDPYKVKDRLVFSQKASALLWQTRQQQKLRLGKSTVTRSKLCSFVAGHGVVEDRHSFYSGAV